MGWGDPLSPNSISFSEREIMEEVYKLKRAPPKYILGKRVFINKLYVLKHYSKLDENYEYTVVSPRAFRKGYFPKEDLLGEYIPSPRDLFILITHGAFSLEREYPVTGDALGEEMFVEGIFKAYYVE
jgi:hypothetical protein